MTPQDESPSPKARASEPPAPLPSHRAVVNITTQTLLPPRYSFLSDTSPTSQLVFCRTITLAQGRMLYDVWDASDTSRHVGYVIPSHILIQSRMLPKKMVQEDWKHLPHHRSERLHVAWEMTSRLFPRIPVFAARKVVERMARLSFAATRTSIEEVVLWYALTEFTAYRFLLENADMDEEEDRLKYLEAVERFEKAVAPSLRLVLVSWLPDDLTTRDELDFCQRLGLLTEVEDKMEKRPSMLRFGGKETAGNMAF